jgi:hypothetical protein
MMATARQAVAIVWTREVAAQQKVMRGGGTQQQAMRQPAGEQEANRRRGAIGQEATGPQEAEVAPRTAITGLVSNRPGPRG